MSRFKVERSQSSPGWWVATDVEHLVVVKFKEHEFNDTQRVTLLSEAPTRDASFYARVMREITDFLLTNYREIL